MVREGQGMGRGPAEIRRDIADTREEIDSHLAELGGRARQARAELKSELDIQSRARQNLPQVLGGAAIAGLLLGLVMGGGRKRYYSPYAAEVAAEEAKLSREWRRLAKERERLAKATSLGEIGLEEAIP
jgi:hypothetical protein